MMPTEIAHVVLPLIIAVSIALMLVRPRGIPEVWWISGGALLLIVLRLVPLKLAGQAIAKGTDVYLFLIGMMLLSELAREQGVFDWVASVSVRGAKGSCSRLFLLVYGVGTLVTIFMSNDATAVVLTPAILTAVRKAKVPPLPYLFVCALIANAASFVLPISNPANLVVFHTAMPPLGRWLSDFGVPSVLSIVATFLVMRILFRDELCKSIECEIEETILSSNGKLVLAGLAMMIGVLLTASAFKKDLGLPTCLAALVITVLASFKARTNPLTLAREISWATLLLVAGLFVMVDAVESVGALNLTQQWLAWASHLGQSAGAMVVGLAVGIANNGVNNLPLGLIAGGTIQASHTKGLIANAVLIGVDLGPNLSVTGSLATILWLLALRKDSGGDTGGEKLDVSFWKFLKVGAVAMPVALFAALGGAILMEPAAGAGPGNGAGDCAVPAMQSLLPCGAASGRDTDGAGRPGGHAGGAAGAAWRGQGGDGVADYGEHLWDDQRPDAGGRAGVLRDGAGWAVLPQSGDAEPIPRAGLGAGNAVPVVGDSGVAADLRRRERHVRQSVQQPARLPDLRGAAVLHSYGGGSVSFAQDAAGGSTALSCMGISVAAGGVHCRFGYDPGGALCLSYRNDLAWVVDNGKRRASLLLCCDGGLLG
jgi:arsenical pump membrane protein